jgi:hypothetical protein
MGTVYKMYQPIFVRKTAYTSKKRIQPLSRKGFYSKLRKSPYIEKGKQPSQY